MSSKRRTMWYESDDVLPDDIVRLRPDPNRSPKDKLEMQARREARLTTVAERWIAGEPVEAIARDLGLHTQTVHKDLAVIFERSAKRRRKMHDRVLDLQLRRLNDDYNHWLPLARMAFDPQSGELNRSLFNASVKAQQILRGIMIDINKLMLLGIYGKAEPVEEPKGAINITVNGVIHEVYRDDAGKMHMNVSSPEDAPTASIAALLPDPTVTDGEWEVVDEGGADAD